MKIKFLAATFLGFCFAANAQNKPEAKYQKTTEAFLATGVESNYGTGLRNEIWSNDFSDPNDWVIGNIPNNANNWIISTNGPSGAFSNGMGAISSTTAANGFALFDSDRLGELNGSAAQNGFIRTADPIDLTGVPGVLVEFQQLFRQFNGRCFLEVSIDGTDWTSFEINQEVAVNATTPNPSTKIINVSSVAGNQETVWIRFRYQSAMQGGEGDYAWMVDDVKITQAPDFDLVVERAYAANPSNDFQYTIIPLAQARPIEIGAAVFNAGGLANTYTINFQIRRGAQVVNSGQFPSNTINPGQSDTTFFETGYTPDQVGDYVIELTAVSSSGQEANPANNTLSTNLRIDQNIFSGMGPVVGQTTFHGTAAPFREFEVGSTFSIVAPATLYGVQVAFGSNTQVGNEALFRVYELGAAFTPISQPYFYQVTSADLSTGTSLNYRNIPIPPVELEADKLYVLVGGNADNGRITFQASQNADPQEVFLYGPFGQGGAVNWFFTLVRPAINMNFDQSLSIGDVNLSNINLNVYPNPTSDLLRVSMNIEKPSQLQINLFDVNGKLVYTESQKDQQGVLVRNIDLQHLNAGLYNLQVVSGNNVNSRKISVVK